MMIPPVSILVGVYSILVKFNGINTHWALILVTAAFGLPLSIYLYTNERSPAHWMKRQPSTGQTVCSASCISFSRSLSP